MLSPVPPLQPSGNEGRHLLRQELLHGEYHRQHLLQRLLGWLWRRLQGGVGAASGTSVVTTLVTMLVAAVLVVGLVLLLSRVRRDRRRRARSAAVLPDDRSGSEPLPQWARLLGNFPKGGKALAGSTYRAQTKVGKLTSAQIRDIAQQKLEDLNARDLDAASKIIAGTARSMGITVEG